LLIIVYGVEEHIILKHRELKYGRNKNSIGMHQCCFSINDNSSTSTIRTSLHYHYSVIIPTFVVTFVVTVTLLLTTGCKGNNGVTVTEYSPEGRPISIKSPVAATFDE
jgi:hypothetical protein